MLTIVPNLLKCSLMFWIERFSGGMLITVMYAVGVRCDRPARLPAGAAAGRCGAAAARLGALGARAATSRSVSEPERLASAVASPSSAACSVLSASRSPSPAPLVLEGPAPASGRGPRRPRPPRFGSRPSAGAGIELPTAAAIPYMGNMPRPGGTMFMVIPAAAGIPIQGPICSTW